MPIRFLAIFEAILSNSVDVFFSVKIVISQSRSMLEFEEHPSSWSRASLQIFQFSCSNAPYSNSLSNREAQPNQNAAN